MSGRLTIAGDWGSSKLRLWLRDGDQTVSRLEGPGIGALAASPEATFLDLIAPWTAAHGPLPARLCGMVGSRNGWVEAPYAACPAGAGELGAGAVSLRAGVHPITIVPGLSCIGPLGAPDVIRGEETQIVGAMALDPTLAQGRRLLLLPGTHSKWARVEDGRIDTFLTAPTGELFALLRDNSSLNRASSEPLADSPAAFTRGLERLRSQGADRLLHLLFEARGRQLIDGLSRSDAMAFLSGLLIAADVAGALASFGPQADVTVIGDQTLGRLYGEALAANGVAARPLDGEACVIAGLTRISSTQDSEAPHVVA